MKKIIVGLLLGLSLIAFVFLYLKFDRQQYDYGFGCVFCEKKLPYNLEAKLYSDYPQRFYLLDEDGFELIGKGFRFYGNSFTINNLLAYGYNGTSIITKVTDSLNNVKYLASYETKYKNKKGNPEISFKDLSNSDFEKIKGEYHWVELDEEKGNEIRFYRTLSFMGAILSLILLLWHLIRKRKVTH